ncbi:hypothetical protein D3C83_255420 [compost metagenome]
MSWLKEGSVKSMAPVCGYTSLPGSTTSISNFRPGGSITCPFWTRRRRFSRWFCETLKVTQIGSTAAT